MIKNKRKISVLFVAAVLVCVFAVIICMFSGSEGANAETVSTAGTTQTTESESPSVRLFTSLSLTMDGGDGKVFVTARNDFTLFPSTVTIILELYKSETLCSSYTEMVLAGSYSKDDLDMGSSVVVSCLTNDVSMYWYGRLRYKINSGSWQEKNTGMALCDAEGNFIQYV